MSKSPDTTKPQTLEEAVYKFARFNPYGTNTPWVRGFIEGAKWGASFAIDAEVSNEEIEAFYMTDPVEGCYSCKVTTRARACNLHCFEAFLAARKKRLGL